MNWLAHLLLSARETHYQLGNLLADPLKCRAWEGATPAFSHGLKMHMAIDRFTDSHGLVSASKARLGTTGRLKGVVIDLLYDHYLSRHWESYATVPLNDFLAQFYEQAQLVSHAYPSQAKCVITGLIRSNRLASYASFTGFVDSLRLIDTRLSPRAQARDSALNYVASVELEYDQLEKDFEQFFPELVRFFQNHALGSRNNHCLKNKL